jgi:eukaryotic-like serine/threonine-protein kinase
MNRQRIDEIFAQAIEIDGGERAAWLGRACAGDGELRAEVERLLRAYARADAFLEHPPDLIRAAALSAGREDAPQQFGVWRVLRSIGSGGMGEVWLGERSDGDFAQRAAIKQLAYPTPGLLQRFRQERQILARLEHPAIARLIDGGVDASGAPYLVMEYVEGVPITRYARDNALDLRTRLELFLGVCDGVQYAHANLVVHRDLKPSNILVTAHGAPKLLDFGIAKVLATTDPSAPATLTASRLLTPDYAAPEQFSGAPVTTATDVYSLGVLLYELLTGARPRRSGPATAEEPPLPSMVDDTGTRKAWRRVLRGDLDRIVLTALATDPLRRYASAEALAGDVRRFLDGRPITAQRDSARYRFGKFARRNRYALGSAVAIVLISVMAALVSMRAAHDAQAQSQRARAARQFLVGVFAQADPEQNRGQPITAHQLLEKGEQQLAHASGDPATAIDVATMLGQLYHDIGDRARAATLLESALTRSADTRLPEDVRARALIASAAVESEDKDSFDAALAHARQGLALLQAAGQPDWEEIANADRLIAQCLVQRGQDTAAVDLLDRSIPIHLAHLGADSEAVAQESVVLGTALGNLARFKASEVAFTQGIDVLRTLHGETSGRLASALDAMSSMFYDEGDFAHAESLIRRVVAIHQAMLGPDHHDTLSARHNLLGDIESQGRYAEALPQRIELLEQSEKSDQLSPMEKAQQHVGLAIDYRELGRFVESEKEARAALARIVATQGENSARSINPMRHVALALAYQGRYDAAEALFRRALAIATARDSATSLVACGLRHDIGRTLRQEHRYAEAVNQLMALTRDACMVGLDERDSWRPQALADLSQAQLAAGQTGSAYATARQAMHYGDETLRGNYLQAIPLFALGRAALARGRGAEAEEALRKALQLRRRMHPDSDPRVVEIEVDLVGALLLQGKTDEARALASEARTGLGTSSTSYAAELRDRLAGLTPHGSARGLH